MLLAYAQGWWVVLLGVGMKESWFDLKGVVILDVSCAMTWSNRKRQGIILKAKTRLLKVRGLEVALMLKAKSWKARHSSSHARRHAIPSAPLAGNPSTYAMEATESAGSAALKRPAPVVRNYCSVRCRRAR
jgi:hypothetical protein